MHPLSSLPGKVLSVTNTPEFELNDLGRSLPMKGPPVSEDMKSRAVFTARIPSSVSISIKLNLFQITLGFCRTVLIVLAELRSHFGGGCGYIFLELFHGIGHRHSAG